MALYQFISNDREYTSWEVYRFDSDDPEETKNAFDPKKLKLFSHDAIHRDGTLIYSYVQKEVIPGVLILEGNRTHGRTENGKRLLYKCIPNNRELPIFLVPYDLKLGFSKDIKNKYIVFAFDHWNDERPRGTIVETLGDVNHLPAYYEYKLYCKNIHDSISNFNRKTKSLSQDCIDHILINPAFSPEVRSDIYIFSIDPAGCTDIDDAISIQECDGIYKVSVYIANVFVWMETFDLWDQIDSRISTIYLPDKRRTMLPTILSENLGSLLENQYKFTFCMDIMVDAYGKVVKEATFNNVYARIDKNYAYEEPKLLKNRYYKSLFDLTKKMRPDVNDSHDVVEFWMLLMNTKAGDKLASLKTGIFRTVSPSSSSLPIQMLELFNNHGSGKYVAYSDDSDSLRHDALSVGAYAHVTSPIRRIVDLLNQSIMMYELELSTSNEKTIQLIQRWLGKLDYINTTTKSIRNVQSDCELMTYFSNNLGVIDRIYTGVVFNRVTGEDCIYRYSVYLEELKVFSTFKTGSYLEEYSNNDFKLYYFGDEYYTKKKIQVHLCIL
jgi:exoribonuclease R